MNRAQFYLIAILCVASLRKFVGAEKVEEGHRDSHHEKDYHSRTKRYTMTRVPLSYLTNRVDDDDDNSYAMDKRFRANSISVNPAASHFRELQVRQTKRTSPGGYKSISPSQMQTYRNLLLYSGRNGNADMEDDAADLDMPGLRDEQALSQTAAAGGIGPLSDEELQTLLSLLEEYRLQGKTASAPLRNFYTPPAQYYTPGMEMAGPAKRETGKRSVSSRGSLVLEQPMSFENSMGGLGGDSYPLFLNQKRSKRVGNLASKRKSTSVTRIKKETDPSVEAELDKVFAGVSSTHQQVENHTSRHSTSIPTTPISSSGQIPPPSSSLKKPKKAIDWSNYFGIDKRQENQKHASANAGSVPSTSHLDDTDHSNTHNIDINNNDQNQQAIHKDSDESDRSTSGTTVSVTNVGAPRDSTTSDAVKEKKPKGKKETSNKENDTDEKPDRKWILKEFYKNLAMSTNVKRKRESPTVPDHQNEIDKLEKIERKMEEAGDQIIWDALKYTGAHKDAELSPEELAQVKNEIIQKLAAAYSLEKVREAIEEFRQQLGQLKDKQQHY